MYLNSVYNFCQAVTRPMMSQRYGRIVNMSSVASFYSNPGQANYAASKGGIQGFTRCIATELARRKITVNAVAPGLVESALTRRIIDNPRALESDVPVRARSQKQSASCA